MYFRKVRITSGFVNYFEVDRRIKQNNVVLFSGGDIVQMFILSFRQGCTSEAGYLFLSCRVFDTFHYTHLPESL